jgi:hypothetical protein
MCDPETHLSDMIRELYKRALASARSMSDYNILFDCEIALGETTASPAIVQRARACLAARMGL